MPSIYPTWQTYSSDTHQEHSKPSLGVYDGAAAGVDMVSMGVQVKFKALGAGDACWFVLFSVSNPPILYLALHGGSRVVEQQAHTFDQ